MRNPALDILRAVAVILVFCRHSGVFPMIANVGEQGVDLFFVLSGFLVAGLLFREYQLSQRVRPGRFLVRRGFKIYPQFYLFIAISVLTRIWLREPAPGPRIASDLFFLQSYFPGIWVHTWSLAVEEHFYLLLAIAIVLLAKRGGDDPFRTLPKWIYAVFATVLCLRLLTWLLIPHFSYATNYFPTHLRIDSLLAGTLLSYFHAFHGPAVLAFVRRFRKWLTPAIPLMFLPWFFLDVSAPFLYTVGFSLSWIGFGLLLLLVLNPVRPPGPPGLAGRGMAALGRVSYPFYLWHLPVLAAFDRLFPASRVHAHVSAFYLAGLCAFGATLLVAFATNWAVEAPFLRLRDRWFPSAARPAQSELSPLQEVV